MKKFKLSAMVIAITALLASCSQSIRLTETESVGKNAVVNSVCENEDLKISYDMWAENGIMYFSVFNKADKPMYIDWKRSVFVYNDWKNNYWVDKSTTETYLVPVGTGKDIAYERKVSTVNAERYTFIPPHTYISVPMTYTIAGSIMTTNTAATGEGKATVTYTDNLKADKSASKVKIPSSTGKGNVPAWEKNFTAENSPNRFRNFLTYSFDEKFATEKFVENEWYTSKYTQMSSKNFFGKKTKVKVNVKIGGKKTSGKVKVYDSPYRKGTSFYKTLIM